MICIDMPGQLKENECSRTIAVAQSLNPHFPFPNRIDLSRTVKGCHLWGRGSLCYFVLTPLCAQRSSHVCWYLPKADLCASADICPQIFPRLLIFAHRSSHNFWYLPTDLRLSADICKMIFAGLLIFAQWSSHICWYLPAADLCMSADIHPQQNFARLLIFA